MISQGVFLYFIYINWAKEYQKKLSSDGNEWNIYEQYIFSKTMAIACVSHCNMFKAGHIYLLTKFSNDVYSIKYVLKAV
jgi:hypothetical protein